MLIPLPLSRAQRECVSVTSHSATDELYSLGTDNCKACLHKLSRSKCAVCKIRMNSQEVWTATTQGAKTCKGFGDILKKADTSSRAAISEERAEEWGLSCLEGGPFSSQYPSESG